MQETSSRLVRDIANFSDHQRWFEFQELYRPMIRNILVCKGLPASEVDDTVQEVFASLLSTINRFQYDRTKGKFRSWLSKITQRAATAHWRKKYQHAVEPINTEPRQVNRANDFDFDDERMKLCLELARSRFDERSWLPFYLRVVEDNPIEEVERITGLNANAIYQAVHRVKTCLKEMMTQLSVVGMTQPHHE